MLRYLMIFFIFAMPLQGMHHEKEKRHREKKMKVCLVLHLLLLSSFFAGKISSIQEVDSHGQLPESDDTIGYLYHSEIHCSRPLIEDNQCTMVCGVDPLGLQKCIDEEIYENSDKNFNKNKCIIAEKTCSSFEKIKYLLSAYISLGAIAGIVTQCSDYM